MRTYVTRWTRSCVGDSSPGRQFLPGLKSWVSLSSEPYEGGTPGVTTNACNSDRQWLGLDEIQVGGRLVAVNFAWAEKS